MSSMTQFWVIKLRNQVEESQWTRIVDSSQVVWLSCLSLLRGSVEQLSKHVAHKAPTFDDAEAGV